MAFVAKNATIQINGVLFDRLDSFHFYELPSSDDAFDFVSVPKASLILLADSPCEIRPEFFDATYSFTIMPLPRPVPRQVFKPHPHNRRWRRRRAYIAKKLAIPPHSIRFEGARLKSVSPDGMGFEFEVLPAMTMAAE